jgi:hypothetical protein
MILELFGFFVLVIILGMITASAFIIGLNYLGDYGIGGIPNTWITRTTTIICWCIIIYLWYILGINAPFIITLNHQ